MLLNDLNYPPKMIEKLVPELECLSSELRLLLDKYLVNQKIQENFSTSDMSIQELIDSYDCNYVSALLTMDWFIKDPAAAKEALKKKIK